MTGTTRTIATEDGEQITYTESSGNVFADLSLDEPEEHLAKAQLVSRIADLITERKDARGPSSSSPVMSTTERTLRRSIGTPVAATGRPATTSDVVRTVVRRQVIACESVQSAPYGRIDRSDARYVCRPSTV